MEHKNLMIYGTGSDVGKSIITAGLCRILKQEGFKVCPFKSQNMALNSYITKDGKEMGRAQVVQAEASGLEPEVYMNPILLKPSTDSKSQVILHGKVLKNMSAQEYYTQKKLMKTEVMKAYDFIKEKFEVSILEGAGSPAEINLKENDLVNTGMAKMADAPAVLVSDIDRGGVFASIYGTLMLLDEDEKARVKGVIINKFRGDVKLLEPGIKMIEEKIGIPILGVVPYKKLEIEEEDSCGSRYLHKNTKGEIKIVVIENKHISNFTDMDVLDKYSDVSVQYAKKPIELEDADIIILPGSKNTIEDLIELKKRGFKKAIIDASKKGTLIFGICGGFQMLGEEIHDPDGIESSIEKIEGFGLLKINTLMEKEKITTQFDRIITYEKGIFKKKNNIKIKGYEIHQGMTYGEENTLFGEKGSLKSAINSNVLGSYIHGIFDNNEFANTVLNSIRKKKGLKTIEENFDYEKFKQNEYDSLASLLKKSLDMDKIYEIIGVTK